MAIMPSNYADYLSKNYVYLRFYSFSPTKICLESIIKRVANALTKSMIDKEETSKR